MLSIDFADADGVEWIDVLAINFLQYEQKISSINVKMERPKLEILRN